MAKWMIQPDTNVVFPYNESVVNEKGWMKYDGPLPVIDPKLGVRVLRDDVAFEDKEQLIREKEEKEQIQLESRKEKMIAAFMKMDKIEFITANGMPKLTSIEKACGFKPTLEEREAAFKEYMVEKEAMKSVEDLYIKEGESQ